MNSPDKHQPGTCSLPHVHTVPRKRASTEHTEVTLIFLLRPPEGGREGTAQEREKPQQGQASRPPAVEPEGKEAEDYPDLDCLGAQGLPVPVNT